MPPPRAICNSYIVLPGTVNAVLPPSSHHNFTLISGEHHRDDVDVNELTWQLDQANHESFARNPLYEWLLKEGVTEAFRASELCVWSPPSSLFSSPLLTLVPLFFVDVPALAITVRYQRKHYQHKWLAGRRLIYLQPNTRPEWKGKIRQTAF